MTGISCPAFKLFLNGQLVGTPGFCQGHITKTLDTTGTYTIFVSNGSPIIYQLSLQCVGGPCMGTSVAGISGTLVVNGTLLSGHRVKLFQNGLMIDKTFTDPDGVYRTLITPPITVTPAPVRFGLGPTLADHVTIGMRQILSRDSVPFVTIPDHGGGTVWINLRSTSPAAVHTSSSRFPIVATGLSFEIIGGDTTGTAWIVAEGPQVVSDSMEVEVGRSQLAIHGRQPPGSLDTLRAIYLEVLDQRGNVRAPAEATTAIISSSNFSILFADSSTLTVPTSVQSSGVSSLWCLRPGTAVIRATDPRPEYYHYDTGSTGLLGCSP